MKADVLAVGLTTLDIVGFPIDAIPPDEAGVLISGIEIVPAGTAGGFALVAGVLGLRAGLISALGDDRPDGARGGQDGRRKRTSFLKKRSKKLLI